MPKAPLLFASSALSLAACAFVPPPAPVRYETGGAQDIWSQGMRLHPAPAYPLAFTSGFHEAALRPELMGDPLGTPLTFLVMAENRSGEPVLLDPKAFRARLPAEGLTLWPLDPEAAIRASNREVADARGEMAHDRGVEAMVHLPLLLLDLASTPAKTRQQAQEDRRFWEDRKQSAEERDARHRERMLAASERHDQWSELALRKTTLFPGMRARGTVSLVANAAAPRPDSLVLFYQGEGGLEVELGRYGRIRDSVEDARHVEATARRDASRRLDSAQARNFPKPGRETPSPYRF